MTPQEPHPKTKAMTPEQKAAEIPEWIIQYDKAGHQSSAGKAIRILLGIINQLPTPEAVAVDWNSVIHDVLSDGTFHNEGLAEKLSEKYKIVNVEAVTVAFGEWLRKEGYEPMGKHWRKYYTGRKKGWHTTSDLFPLFTASPEYKELFK